MNFKISWFVGISFLLTFVVYFFLMNFLYPNLLNQGEFQDFFAGLSALFSGLAFMGLIIAILLQKEELGLQRKELELTRAELQRAAEAQERSERALLKQAASLKITAKLNGMSAMLQYKSSLIETIAVGKYGNNGIAPDLKSDADGILEQIENIIREK